MSLYSDIKHEFYLYMTKIHYQCVMCVHNGLCCVFGFTKLLKVVLHSAMQKMI